MRAILVVLAVVCTVLLGIIAIELYPIARVAGGVLSLGAPSTETREQRNVRLRRESEEFSKDLDAVVGVNRPAPGARTPQTPPPSKTPAR
jgi:hypothetical protein